MWVKPGTSLHRKDDELDRLKGFADADILLSREYIFEEWVPLVVKFTVLIYIFYGVSLVLLRNIRLPQDYGEKDSVFKKRKRAFQLVSILGNACLGCMGIFYEYLDAKPVPSMEETVQGFQKFQPLSSFQFAYQMWALPIGIVHINESSSMIIHHIAVLFVSFFSGCFTNGFRYYIPFFFGIFEISSVPLVVMNVFRENEKLRQVYPILNQCARISFAFSFLLIRLFLNTPIALVYLRDLWFVFTGSSHRGYLLFMSAVFGSSLVLFVLQFWWGLRIAKGLLSVIFAGNVQKRAKAS